MRSRARAIALARLGQVAWLPLFAALLLALACLSAAEAAPAGQSQPEGGLTQSGPMQGGQGELQTRPPAAGVSKAAPGVLKPKTNPDPGMMVATPNPKAFPTPIIPPPGSKGNAPQVEPK
jgi:hypothetical protein